MDLDLSVPIVTGYNNEVLANAVVKAQRRQGEMRALSLEGRIGRSTLTARVCSRGQGPPLLLVEAEDGGAFLRFHDIYRRAFGGSFILHRCRLATRAARASCSTAISSCAMSRPAARGWRKGMASSGIGGDRAVSGPRMTDTGDVAFTKLRAEFSRTPNRIDFRDIVIWGPLLGFTAQANVDFAATGWISPAHSCRAMLSTTPSRRCRSSGASLAGGSMRAFSPSISGWRDHLRSRP